MKNKIIQLFVGTGLLSATVYADPFLRVIQPYENAEIPAVAQSFVFGSVLPATATLRINGVEVKPYTNGGFLAMVPFTPGKFRIDVVAFDGVSTATVTRSVNVASPPVPNNEIYGKIDPVSPKQRVVVRPGDMISVAFTGAPNGDASFVLAGKENSYPMTEVSSGSYKGIYKIQPNEALDDTDIVFTLKRSDGKKLTQRAGAKITVQRRALPRYIDLKEDAILLTGPASNYGYQMFLLKGARLEVTGEWGEFLRVSLERGMQGWIKKNVVIEQPAGAGPYRSVARNIKINVTPDSTIMTLPLQFVHPHRVEQFTDPYSYRITLYGVAADTDRIRYKSTDSAIEDISWDQPSPGIYVLTLKMRQKSAWGYDVRYEGTQFVFEVRHKPHVTGGLKGVKVAVDAGHSNDNFGTIGPWGNTEASVVLMAAKATKKALEARGAEVVMIQDGTRELTLQDRVAMAWREKAQIYLSIHADACAEGVNPRDIQGYSVHYYHPQSRPLAESIHKIYGQRTAVPDQGLWRSNLAVCRMPQMPSILMEQAFLILPEYEELMLSKKHQDTVAETLADSIQEFLKKSE